MHILFALDWPEKTFPAILVVAFLFNLVRRSWCLPLTWACFSLLPS